MATRAQRVRVSSVSRSGEIEQQGKGNIAATADSQGVTVHGWALGRDAAAVTAEALDEEGSVLARVPVGLERPDVVSRLGNLPGAERSGFKLRLEPRRPGSARLTVRVHFDNGETAPVGTLELSADGVDAEDPGGPHWRAVADWPERRRVLVGRDGWLFLSGDRNDALGQHTGRVGFSDEQKDALRALLASRQEAAEASGATWLTAVVPDKEMVYADFLPPGIVPVERRPIHDYLDVAAEANAPVVYLLDAFRAARGRGDLYMKTDTHWNHLGAFVAAEEIWRELASIGHEVEGVEEGAIAWREEPVQGDLGSKLYPEVLEGADVTATLSSSYGRLVYDNKVRNHGRVLIYEQTGRPGPSCVVFGESFGPTLLFFLKESFRRVVFVHTSMLVSELIELERPDVVISLPIERFLIQIPDDSEAMAKLAETVRAKNGELPQGWVPG